jgi:hypothetical protein
MLYDIVIDLHVAGYIKAILLEDLFEETIKFSPAFLVSFFIIYTSGSPNCLPRVVAARLVNECLAPG